VKLFATGGKVFVCNVGGVAFNAALLLALAKYLGPHGQGLFTMTLTVIMIVAAIGNGGLGLAAVPLLRRGEVSLGRVLRAQGLWLVVVAMLLLVVAFVLRRAYGAGPETLPLHWSGTTVLAVALGALALIAFDIFTYDLQAMGRLVVSPFFNFLRTVINLMLVGALLVATTISLDGAVGAFALAQALAVAALAVVVVRQARRGPMPAANADSPAAPALWTLIGRCFRHGWVGQVSVVSFILLMRLDQYLVEYYHDAATVGIYSVAVLVGEMLLYLPRALYPLLVHSSADDRAGSDRDQEAARAVRVGLAVTLAAAVPVFLIAIPLLPLLAGGAYQASGPALRALLPGIVAMAPAHILAGDFVGRGHPGWNAQASLLTVVANIAVGVILIPRLGAVGASLASSLAYAVGATLMIQRFRRETGLGWSVLLVPRRNDFRR